MSLVKIFGLHVRSLRKTRDLTQEALAEKVDVSNVTISNVERGISAPSFDWSRKLQRP